MKKLLILIIILVVQPVTVSAHNPGDLLSAIRAVRGDNIISNPTLTELAQKRAQEITKVFDHREDALPLKWPWGEILGWSSFPQEGAALGAVMSRWKNTPGHEAILFGNWNRVGVGTSHANGRHYFVAIFAKVPGTSVAPRPTPLSREPRATPGVTLPPTDTGGVN